MTAHCVVSITTNQQILAVGRGCRRVRIVNLARPKRSRQLRKDHGHQRPLGKAVNLLLRRVRQQRRARPLRLTQSLCYGVSRMCRVRIGKQQPLPLSDLCSALAGMAFAAPASRQLSGADHLNRKALGNRPRAVRRMVIHHNDLELNLGAPSVPLFWERVGYRLLVFSPLPNQRLQAHPQALFFIPRRHNHGHIGLCRSGCHRRRRTPITNC